MANEHLSEIVPLPTEFMEWKEEYEKDTKSSFTKVTGVKGKGETTLTYYYCNMSVFFFKVEVSVTLNHKAHLKLMLTALQP